MTTLAHKTLRSKRPLHSAGFTLLEIIITLAIIATIMGGAVVFLASRGSGAVESVALKTQVLAKETLRESKRRQRPHSIFISSTAIWAAPETTQQTLDDENLDSDLEEQERIKVSEEVTVSYQLSGEDNWNVISKDDQPFVWAFTQSGLCDGISLRFEDDDTIHETTFHPLTAGEIVDGF